MNDQQAVFKIDEESRINICISLSRQLAPDEKEQGSYNAKSTL